MAIPILPDTILAIILDIPTATTLAIQPFLSNHRIRDIQALLGFSMVQMELLLELVDLTWTEKTMTTLKPTVSMEVEGSTAGRILSTTTTITTRSLTTETTRSLPMETTRSLPMETFLTLIPTCTTIPTTATRTVISTLTISTPTTTLELLVTMGL